ncbi:hypothetical protein [Nostoc sp. NMS7]|nr:hypothetical protein [Nostoc sp. NMS7]
MSDINLDIKTPPRWFLRGAFDLEYALLRSLGAILLTFGTQHKK